MRIAIDLQACQHGAAVDADTTVALARALATAAQAAGHTVLLLLHHAYPERADAVRRAFAPQGVPQWAPWSAAAAPGQLQLHVLDTARGTDPWRLSAAALLRATALRDWRADVVWTPGLFERASPGAVIDVRPIVADNIVAAPVAAGPVDTVQLDLVPAVYSLATSAGLDHEANANAVFEPQFEALGHARLLTGANPATVEALRRAAPGVEVVHAPTAEAVLAVLVSARVPAEGTGLPPAATPGKPLMAFLSPLPPQHSGIADYSVELLAQLEQFYEIELIVNGPLDAALGQRHTVRDCAWFDQHADRYARVLYHFGNSDSHIHMFDLLRRHPGIVVLHDFFLSGVLDNMDRAGFEQSLLNALYTSHGHTALLARARKGRNASIWDFPCNKDVLDHASGVIVHSDFSRRLAAHWYGADSADQWQTVPLIRGLPASYQADAARASARAGLGLGADDFLICSFGMMGVTKRNDLLLDAFLASPLAADPRCHLIFVGAPDPGPYGIELARKIEDAGLNGRIRITGFIDAGQYASHLAAADAAVQLRSQTRGETSASVLDCLLYGLPTVVNAHGSNTDLPADVLLQLPDDCVTASLTAALAMLHAPATGGAARATLAARARAYMAAHHAPHQVGPRFRDAIETLNAHSPARHYAALVAAVRALPSAPDGALMDTAAAIAANRLPQAPRQLFVDISAMVDTDLKTGIQRVVRSILLRLIETPPPGFRVEPVFGSGGNRTYRYARNHTLRMLGCPPMLLEDAPLELHAGDVFLGLDLFTNGTAQNRERLLDMRRRGVQINFVVYDVLPVLQPEVFPVGTDAYFAAYLDTIHAVADGVLCISRAVADELHDWLAERPGRTRRDPLPIGYFHLGADIDASAPSMGLPEDADQVLAAVNARPSMLLVGTLEPRKGQAQALAAIEQLWRDGVDVNLVVVGKNGWMVEALAQRLREHPERGQRLFWLPGVSDEMLGKLYQSCSALVAPSIGEGFGLPLIEAAQHGLPIIARDLPVFREVGGEHAYYFSGTEASALAEAIQQWLFLHAAGAAPQSSSMPWLTWKASAEQLLEGLERRGWHRILAPADMET